MAPLGKTYYRLFLLFKLSFPQKVNHLAPVHSKVGTYFHKVFFQDKTRGDAKSYATALRGSNTRWVALRNASHHRPFASKWGWTILPFIRNIKDRRIAKIYGVQGNAPIW